jgi:hypothetical protein
VPKSPTSPEGRSDKASSPETTLVVGGRGVRRPRAIHAWLGTKIGQWPVIKPYITAAHEAAAQDAEIQEAIDVWFENAISDIHRGLDNADRFAPSSRWVRGTLAFGQLEFASRRWMRHGWDVDRDETHSVLTESWFALLVD